MAKRLRYGKGRASIEIDGALKNAGKALKEVAPMTLAIIEAELDERVEHAKKIGLFAGIDPSKTRDGSFRTVRNHSEALTNSPKGFVLSKVEEP